MCRVVSLLFTPISVTIAVLHPRYAVVTACTWLQQWQSSFVSTGKSTLLKLMVGELTPTEGEVKRHSHLAIARYHQHSVDQLDNSSVVLEFFQVAARTSRNSVLL